ncbi:MAG TPA: hypothetical protein VKU00_32820 [Chthonomonadaceae bacterium]|nr:hypothetical protein [Chthonomonadaceae bacterium]
MGLPARSVTITDTDLSTVSADPDKVLVVEADPPYIAHLELQSNYKADDAERFMGYNMMVGKHHGLLVRKVVFLLRPEADGPGMRAPFVRQFPGAFASQLLKRDVYSLGAVCPACRQHEGAGRVVYEQLADADDKICNTLDNNYGMG